MEGLPGAQRNHRGGILGLRRLLEEYGEAIEADLPAHYPGVRLRHLFTGELTWRELRSLIRGLPPTSRLRTAIAGRPLWTATEYLLADVFDVLAAANWQRTGDKSAAKPKPYPRPVVRDQQADAAKDQARAAARERARTHQQAVEAGYTG
ncbi:DUF5361 domain-containing protein [Kitasatospora sp. NPDC004615]|uniref:DUF5361 domain-containing protein n=1 Tax=Kitasatospora sp. NPDC004615 TaxID=3364017 RepID=UPI0036802058